MTDAKQKKKLLYITDQEEYAQHGAIGPLFNGYLKDHCDVYIVYFTKYKNSFQIKGTDYVVPQQYEKKVCQYLGLKGIDISSFDFVFVRNQLDILAHVLKLREKFGYKVGFRVSAPKSERVFAIGKAEHRTTIFDKIGILYKRYRKKSLRSKCDLFMPKSKDVEETFYGGSNVVSFPLPSGLDPSRVTPFKTSHRSERHFLYVGRLDTLRHFEKILEAFSKVNSSNWHLSVSTHNYEFAKKIMDRYTNIDKKVSILKADNLNDLMYQINDADVGIALFPDISLFNTSIPAKIMDYSTCAIPSLMSENSKNRILFNDENALFCEYEVDAMAAKFEEIITMTEDELAKIGHAGQDRLLQHKRNYKIMAKELYEVLESL